MEVQITENLILTLMTATGRPRDEIVYMLATTLESCRENRIKKSLPPDTLRTYRKFPGTQIMVTYIGGDTWFDIREHNPPVVKFSNISQAKSKMVEKMNKLFEEQVLK